MKEIYSKLQEVVNSVPRTDMIILMGDFNAKVEWKQAVIVPIYKKKDKLGCNNYRGISLLGHYSKIFTSILIRANKQKDGGNFIRRTSRIQTVTKYDRSEAKMQ
jgi:hypothetical protein